MNNSVDWKFYLKSKDAWDAITLECKEATASILLEQYILENDNAGRKLIDVLKQKAKEGVIVKVLCDMAGSFSFYNSPLPKELVSLGADVRFFNTIKPWRVTNFTSWFFRDHRKILVIDSRTAFVGGVNFREDMAEWRDTHVRVTGDIITDIMETFAQMWKKAEKKSFFRLKKIKHYAKGFSLLTNSPGFGQRFVYYSLLNAARNARKRILLTTPYFIPDHRLFRVLKLAAKRGVEVKIIIPEKSDVVWADTASRSFFHTLLKAGIKIFLYKDKILHAKTFTVDGNWGSIGSFNLDNLSFFFNHEANISSDNPKFVNDLEGHFSEDLKRCREVQLEEWNKRPLSQKLKERFMRLFKDIL